MINGTISILLLLGGGVPVGGGGRQKEFLRVMINRYLFYLPPPPLRGTPPPGRRRIEILRIHPPLLRIHPPTPHSPPYSAFTPLLRIRPPTHSKFIIAKLRTSYILNRSCNCKSAFLFPRIKSLPEPITSRS